MKSCVWCLGRFNYGPHVTGIHYILHTTNIYAHLYILISIYANPKSQQDNDVLINFCICIIIWIPFIGHIDFFIIYSINLELYRAPSLYWPDIIIYQFQYLCTDRQTKQTIWEEITYTVTNETLHVATNNKQQTANSKHLTFSPTISFLELEINR